MGWLDHVRADPRPWLLAEDAPPVCAARAAAWRDVLVLCSETTSVEHLRLNGHLLRRGLVDEISLVVTPYLAGDYATGAAGCATP